MPAPDRQISHEGRMLGALKDARRPRSLQLSPDCPDLDDCIRLELNLYGQRRWTAPEEG